MNMGRPRSLVIEIDWNDPEDVALYEQRRRAEKGQEELFAMKHEEIAKELGISRERVGQIERRAIAKIRAAFQGRGITSSAELTAHGKAGDRRKGTLCSAGRYGEEE